MKASLNTKQGTHSIIFWIALIFILYLLKPIIMPFILAVILAIMVFPIQKFFEKYLRCNRLLATICSISFVLVVTIAVTFTIGSQLDIFIDKSDTYVKKIVELYTDTISQIEGVFNVKKRNSLLAEDINVGGMLREHYDKVSAFALEWGTILVDLVLIPIYMFYFLYYRKFFRNFAYHAFKHKSKSFINSIIKKIYKIQRKYLLGLIKVILIVGTLNSIGLLLLGIENALFFGFFAAILLVIPYIGVIIGSLLPALVALATKDTYWYALGVLMVFSFIQFIEGYFITPNIIGADVSINSFIAIVALIVFAMLWGIAGMVVALPITATLKILFDNSENYKAYGFLIGEPEDRFLQSQAQARLKKWKAIRNVKIK